MAIIKRIRGHILLIGFMVAAVVASGTALLFTRSEPKTQSDSDALVPLAARVDKIDGTVGIDRQSSDQGPDRSRQADQPTQATQPDQPNLSEVPDQQGNQASQQEWKIPARNAPVSVGDRIYVGDRSHLGVAFSGRNYARLNPNTELEVLSLAERRAQLALREGSAVFDVGALAPGELCEVGTPYGAVDLVKPGLYQVGIGDGNALVSVLSGLAQVVGLGGSGQCSRGQLLTLGPSALDEALVSQIDPGVCGNIVDDYYSYRYPDSYDGRYENYDTYLSDPYYYDPYRRSVSYQYCPVEEDIAGLSDLDTYGDWDDVDGYGHCWRPNVSAGWAPYQDGYWLNDYPLGLTWVSQEPWGWAPYHYGRWAFANSAWYWVPQEAIARPVYAPALCAFVPLPQYQQIGWCPLGPGDPYVPRYYDAAFRPQYIGPSVVVNRFVNVNRIVNYNVPGAVTVVPSSALAGVIRPGVIVRADQRVISQTRPVLDPFAVPSLRQAGAGAEPMRPRAQVPGIVAARAFNRPVIASDPPALPGAMAGSKLEKSLRVQTVPRDVTKRQLRMNDTGQVVAARRPDGLPLQVPAMKVKGGFGVNGGPGVNGGSMVQPGAAGQSAGDRERQQQIQALASRAAQGDRSARREMRQLQQQQVQSEQQQAAQQRQAQRAAQQAEQNAQFKTQREQRRLERQQAAVAQQQQQAQAAQQAEQRRQARQQAAQQGAARQEQLSQQRQAEKQAARQQQQQQLMRQQQVQQQRQADRQAARQQQQDMMRQQQLQQQRQAERQAARQQQQDMMRQQQVQQQRQAERQAARQQQQDMMRQQQAQQQRQAERQAARQQQQDMMRQQQVQQQRQADRQAARQQQQDMMRQQQAQQQRQADRQAARQQQQRQAPPQQQAPPSGGQTKADRKAARRQGQ